MTDSSVPPPTSPRNPFRLRIAPEEAVPHKGWRQAGEQALKQLLAGPGLVVVLGKPGTGKTLLLRDIQRRLRARGREARLITRDDAPLDPASPPLAPRAGELFVLIDEAQAAGAILAAGSAAPGMHCLLIGLPEAAPQFSALVPRPAIVRLGPLSPKEARAFVLSRIAQAERPADLLMPDALDRLVDVSGGIPRVLCVLGATALHFARVEASTQVTGEHVARAIQTGVVPYHAVPRPITPLASDPVARLLSSRLGRVLVPDAPAARRRRGAAALALALLLLAGSFWSLLHRHRPRADAPAAASAPTQPPPSLAERTDPVPPTEGPARSPPLPQDTANRSVAPLVPMAALVPGQAPAHDAEPPRQPPSPAESVARSSPAPGDAAPVSPSSAQPKPSTTAAELPAVSPPPGTAQSGPAQSGPTQSGPTQSGPPPATLFAMTPPTPTHLVISYPRDDREPNHPGNPDDAPAPAAALAGQLRRAGYLVGDPVPVARNIATPVLFAYFAEDLPAAEELRAALGQAAPEIVLVALPPGSSLPRPGTLEITIPPDAPVVDWSDALTAAGAHPPAEQASSAAAAQPTFPADNATIAASPLGNVALEWSDPAEHAVYFVEVQAVDGSPPHEVFAAYADHGPVQVALDPASHLYAWRIHAVAEAGGHYRLGQWSHFTVQPAGPPGRANGSTVALPPSEAAP